MLDNRWFLLCAAMVRGREGGMEGHTIKSEEGDGRERKGGNMFSWTTTILYCVERKGECEGHTIRERERE